MVNKHEEMFNIITPKGNANENYIDIPSHTSQNGYHEENIKSCLGCEEKRNPYTVLVGI
jgi:hypothetical protein